MTDFAAYLRAMQGSTARFAGLVSNLDAVSQGDVSTWDDSRTVCVHVAQDGMPNRIVVRDGWAAAVQPSGLGAAVVRTAGAAAATRAQAIGEMLRDHPPQDPDVHEAYPASGGTATFGAPLVEPREPRMSVSELAEEAISALSRVCAETEPPQPPVGTGTAANGAVRITLTAGSLSSCVIDERWADGRSTLQVTLALQQALDGARTSLVNAQDEPPAATDDSLDDLLAEAMAHLSAITGTGQEEATHE